MRSLPVHVRVDVEALREEMNAWRSEVHTMASNLLVLWLACMLSGVVSISDAGSDRVSLVLGVLMVVLGLAEMVWSGIRWWETREVEGGR